MPAPCAREQDARSDLSSGIVDSIEAPLDSVPRAPRSEGREAAAGGIEQIQRSEIRVWEREAQRPAGRIGRGGELNADLDTGEPEHERLQTGYLGGVVP